MISESFIANLFALAGTLYLVAVAWPLSRIDVLEHRLPNRLVLPAFPIAIAGHLVASTISNQWFNFALAVAAMVLSLIVGLAANRWASLGMGDVKLISAISLAVGWFSFIAPLLAIVLAFVIASLVVLVLVALGKTSLGRSFALGPYLLVGFVVTQILTWSTYFGGFSPSFFM
jgi:leader peptidase (prepilin peptidase)/N-methyltransferase